MPGCLDVLGLFHPALHRTTERFHLRIPLQEDQDISVGSHVRFIRCCLKLTLSVMLIRVPFLISMLHTEAEPTAAAKSNGPSCFYSASYFGSITGLHSDLNASCIHQ